MKNLKKKILAGVLSATFIFGGLVMTRSCGSGGPGEPPLQGSNFQVTETFHC